MYTYRWVFLAFHYRYWPFLFLPTLAQVEQSVDQRDTEPVAKPESCHQWKNIAHGEAPETMGSDHWGHLVEEEKTMACPIRESPANKDSTNRITLGDLN